MKLYVSYFKLIFNTNIQYRSAAIAGVLTQLFFAIIGLSMYTAFYKSGMKTHVGLTLEQALSYVWLMQAFYFLVNSYTKDKDLINNIQNGNFAYELVRPGSVFGKNLVKMIAIKLSGVLTRFPLVIAVGFIIPKPYGLMMPNSVPALLLFIVCIFASAVLLSTLLVIVHLITAYTIQARANFTLFSAVFDILSGSLLPLAFLPNFLQKIAYVLPFRYVIDLPFRLYTGAIPFNEGIVLFGEEIIWIIIFVSFGYFLTDRIMRRAVVQGG